MATCRECKKSGLLLKLNFDGLCEDCFFLKQAAVLEMMSPEQKDLINLQEQLRQAKDQHNQLMENIAKAASDLRQIYDSVESRKKQIINLDEQIMLQEFGLYEPRFKFCTAEEYKVQLAVIREKQKNAIKNKMATTGSPNWSLNGSTAQGQKMLKDVQKLLLRAFNSECDELVDKLKYNNYPQSVKKIMTSWETISKLGAAISISITTYYRDLKFEELSLALEYQQKKQAEKEEQKELRESLREQARLQKELEDERKKLEKEQSHYQNAFQKILQQIESFKDSDDAYLLAKKTEIEARLTEITTAITQIDYRQANQKAGYVYVISNVGSFGEGVYKIGMTRRLDPIERIDELSDASVPFNFDVHAMIFSEDAPKLEAALHNAFSDKKVNMVNTRREFFNVTLDEIKSVIKKNYDKTAEFADVADAEQYWISLEMKKTL